MDLVIPTWDLVIIILFVVITAYSFIIRASGTAKVILSTYVAILAADGLGNVIFQHVVGPDPTIQLFNIAGSQDTIITLKLAFFVLIVVFMAIKGAFESNLAEESTGMTSLIITLILGILCSGLIVSAMLVYMSGGSFLTGLGYSASDLALSIYQNSQAARIMIDNSTLWFSLPAIAFLISSMLTSE